MAISISAQFKKLLNNLTPGANKTKLGDIITDLYKRIINPDAGRTVTGATTLVLDDADTVITANSGSSVALTITNDATGGWSGNVVITAYQAGAGAVSFSAGAGVTLRNPSGPWAAAQYGVIRVMRVGANEWTRV
jgi:hypothetical protein